MSRAHTPTSAEYLDYQRRHSHRLRLNTPTADRDFATAGATYQYTSAPTQVPTTTSYPNHYGEPDPDQDSHRHAGS